MPAGVVSVIAEGDAGAGAAGGSLKPSLRSENTPRDKEVWNDGLELDRTGTEETHSRQGRKMRGPRTWPQDKLGISTLLRTDTENPEQLLLQPPDSHPPPTP